MYKIKIFSDFADSRVCKKNYEKICNVSKIKFYGENKKIYITENDDYTHAIIINKAMPILTVAKENVIGFSFEPYELLKVTNLFIIYVKTCVGKYFIGDTHNLSAPFIEQFQFLWYSNPCKSLTFKPKLMSICVSEKLYAPGHIYRHKLVNEIIKLNLPIDIYGRGSKFYDSPRVKGEFNDIEPYKEYLFSICIENYRNADYFSEKIISPLMCNCMPIYLGCKNIRKYFKNDVILLTNDIYQDIKIILEVLTNPLQFYKKTYKKTNKKVNLIRNIERLYH